MAKGVLLCAVFSCFLAKGYSQNESTLNGLWLEGKVQYGFVLPHNSTVAYLMNENLKGFDIGLSTESNNRHEWESLFRNPRYGVSYSYINLGNQSVLGALHSLYGYIDVPFFIPKSRHVFSYQVDFGVSYAPATYNKYNNPLNHLVSADLSLFIGFDLIGRIKVGERNELKAALELTHCSNGKMRTPNLGINMGTFSLAYLYNVKKSSPVSVAEITDLPYKKHYFEIIGNVGGKRDDNLKDDVYLISSAIIDYYYAVSPKYAFGLGTDLFYDGSLAQHQEFFENVPRDNSVNYQVGLHGGFHIRFGNFFIVANAGNYLYYQYLRHGTFYTRIGMRYALTDAILLNFTLKAHSTIADYIEWGVGYRFKTKGR